MRRSSRYRRGPAHRRCPGRLQGETPRRTRSGRGMPASIPIASISASRARGSHAPSFIGWRTLASSPPMSSQLMPGRQIAWRGRLGFIVIAEHFAVDLEIAVRLAVVPPERVLAQRAELRDRGIFPRSPVARRHASRCRIRRMLPVMVVMIRDRSAERLLPARDGGIGGERRLHLFFGRPPVGTFDLGDTLADDRSSAGRYDTADARCRRGTSPDWQPADRIAASSPSPARRRRRHGDRRRTTR